MAAPLTSLVYTSKICGIMPQRNRDSYKMLLIGKHEAALCSIFSLSYASDNIYKVFLLNATKQFMKLKLFVELLFIVAQICFSCLQ